MSNNGQPTSVANPGERPCNTDASEITSFAAGPLRVTLGPAVTTFLHVVSSTIDGGFATADAAILRVDIGTVHIEGLTAHARIGCPGGQDGASVLDEAADADVVRVTINGQTMTLPPTGPIVIPIPGIGTITMRDATTTPFSAVAHAFVLESPVFGTVIIGEARVGITPTATAPCEIVGSPL